MNDWSSRQISGVTFAGVGVSALLLQTAISQALSGSLFWMGLSQSVLSAIGLGGVVIGLYRFATKDRK